MSHDQADKLPIGSFSHYGQVAQLHFDSRLPPSLRKPGQRARRAACGVHSVQFAEDRKSSGGASSSRNEHFLRSLSSEPITSVGLANAQTYPASAASLSSRHGTSGVRSDLLPGGGGAGGGCDDGRADSSNKAVYNFSSRVILTAGPGADQFANSPAAWTLREQASTEYIYKTILGCKLNRSASTSDIMYASGAAPYHCQRGDKPPQQPTTTGSASDGTSGPPPPTHTLSASSSSGGSRPSHAGPLSPDPTARFRCSRRPADTKVVHVNPKVLPSTRRHAAHRGVNGFFPPVKLRDPNLDPRRKRLEGMRTPPFVLELAPEEAALWAEPSPLRTPSAKSVARSDPSWNSQSRQNNVSSWTPPVYPHVSNDASCDDLTAMPRPRMMVSRGELPWVFRHKVKKSMNELSKIMASRPPQALDPSGSFGYRLDV